MGVAKENSETKNEIHIPVGKAKSGRMWKHPQTSRSSTQQRRGVLSHLNKTFEEKEAIRQKNKETKLRETEMTNDKKEKIKAEKDRRLEQAKRRAENELKAATYTQLNASKIKGMSKKQLRSIRKTQVNAQGQVELVNPWAESGSSMKKIIQKKKK